MKAITKRGFGELLKENINVNIISVYKNGSVFIEIDNINYYWGSIFDLKFK